MQITTDEVHLWWCVERLILPLARLSSSDALPTAGVLTFTVEPCSQYRKIRSWLCVCWGCIHTGGGENGVVTVTVMPPAVHVGYYMLLRDALSLQTPGCLIMSHLRWPEAALWHGNEVKVDKTGQLDVVATARQQLFTPTYSQWVN